MVITAQIRFTESPTEEKDVINWRLETEVSNGTNTIKNEIGGLNKPHEVAHEKLFDLRSVVSNNIQQLFRNQLQKTHPNFSPDNIQRLEEEAFPATGHQNPFNLYPEEIAEVRKFLSIANDPETIKAGKELRTILSDMETVIQNQDKGPELTNTGEEDVSRERVREARDFLKKSVYGDFPLQKSFLTEASRAELERIFKFDSELTVESNFDFVQQVALWQFEFSAEAIRALNQNTIADIKNTEREEIAPLSERHNASELRPYFIRIHTDIQRNPQSIFHKIISPGTAEILHKIFRDDPNLMLGENADFIEKVAKWHRKFLKDQANTAASS